MSEIEAVFKDLIEQFHEKMKEDKSARDKLAGKEVRMVVIITDENRYKFHLKDGEIIDFGVGDYADKDVTVSMAKETFTKMQTGDLSPMRAFMTKKIQFEGSMSHMLLMRGVLTGE